MMNIKTLAMGVLAAVGTADARSLRGLQTGPEATAAKGPATNINTVYYMRSDEGKGEDFAELRSLGVNSLNIPFYNPAEITSTGELAPWKDSGASTGDDLVNLAKAWQSALGSEPGQLMLSLGGVTLDSELWGAAFKDPSKLGTEAAKIVKDLQQKASTTSLKIGIDFDLEDVEDIDGQAVADGMGGFLKAFRAGCSRSECPVQVDVLSLFWKDFNPEWQRQLMDNGPTTTDGFDYLGLMVGAEPASGEEYMNYWGGNDAGKFGAFPKDLAAKIPLSSRMPNFWGTSAMDGKGAQLENFPTSPGSLYTWLKSNNMNVAWWVWNPTEKDGGSAEGKENMEAVKAAVGFN